MKCPICGNDLPPHAVFCANCGSPLLENLSNQPAPVRDATPQPPLQNGSSLPGNLSGQPVPVPVRNAATPVEDITVPRPPLRQQTPSPPIFIPTPPQPQPPASSLTISWRAIVLIGLAFLLIVGLLTGLLLFFTVGPGSGRGSTPTPTPTPSQKGLPLLPARIYTVQFPDKEYVGVNDGSQPPFDIRRQDSQNLRKQAIDALHSNQNPTSFWSEYLTGANSNDAEISIYLENQQIKNYPSFTLIVGIDFSSASVPEAQTPTRSALQGIYLAQKEYNDDPKNTTKMQLLLANTGDDKAYVSKVATQIAGIVQQDKDKKILGIIGWQTSVRTQAMLDALHQNHVDLPMVSETASYDKLPDTSPNYFGIAAPDEQQARLTVAEILHKNYSQVIVFKDTSNLYSQNIAEDFENHFPNSIEVPFTTEFTTAATYTTTLTRALKQVHDINHLAVFFTGSTNYDMVQLQDALVNFNNYPHFPIFTGDAGYVAHPVTYDRWYVLAYAYHDEWSRLMGKQAPFSIAYDQAFDPDQHFKGYGYGLPDAVSIISYDTAQVVAQSVKKVLSSQSPNLQDALATFTSNNPWQGVSGQIAFDNNRHLVDRALIILEIKTNIDPQTGKKSGGSFQMICLQGTFSNTANNSLPVCPA